MSAVLDLPIMPPVGDIQPKRDYSAGKPTHCVRGCGHPLPPSAYRYHRYTCKRCLRLHGPEPRPRLTLACLTAGCSAPGGGRTGYCGRCYSTVWARRRRRERLIERVVGESIPFEFLIRFPDDSRSRTHLRRLLLAFIEGRIGLVDNTGHIGRWKRSRA